MDTRGEAENIYHGYIETPEGDRRWKDAWRRFPAYNDCGEDTDAAVDFIVEGMADVHAARFGDAWDGVREVLREMVDAGLT